MIMRITVNSRVSDDGNAELFGGGDDLLSLLLIRPGGDFNLHGGDLTELVCDKSM